MKTNDFTKAIVVFLLLSMISPAMATTTPVSMSNHESRAAQLQNRLAEIKAMDRTVLSRTEKKALRREVREIKKELAAISGGVYLTVGAIVLIALLLILLL